MVTLNQILNLNQFDINKAFDDDYLFKYLLLNYIIYYVHCTYNTETFKTSRETYIISQQRHS